MENSLPPSVRIYSLGDQGLCIDWGKGIDEAVNAQVLVCFERLRAARLQGVRDIIPTYSSLNLMFDAGALLRQDPGVLPYDLLCGQLASILALPLEVSESPGQLIEIPVCYAPEFAPDLDELSRQCGFSPAEIAHLHSSREYRVYMIGFLPGFPYMGIVDARIAAPRLAQPRIRVPLGSVGIAGLQTGIYPLESPGGWNLIGRTPLPLFDPEGHRPTLLTPGDRVRFYSVSPEQFHQLKSNP